MRKIITAGIGALALAAALQPAAAADLPRKPPVYKAPPPVVVYDPWTGFYVGVNLGYSWAKWDSDSLLAIFPTGGGLGTTASPNVKGWLGGLQAGYNWRVDPRWLVGIEGDIQITGERASSNGSLSFNDGGACCGGDFNLTTTINTTNEWKFPWFATLRGRIGALVDPETLFYVTGGLAIGEFKCSNQATISTQPFGPGSTGTIPEGPPVTVAGPLRSERTTQAGFAVGAGAEKKFTRNWSGKIEYLYLDFGRHTFLSGTGFDTSVRLRDHIVRVGVNYAFDPAVVAKY